MTGLYIIGGAIIAVVAYVFWSNWRSEQTGEWKAEARNLDAGLKGVGDAKKADDAVARMPAGSVTERLSKWQRD